MVQLALMFPGQGSQYVGMGKRMLESFPEASRIFEEANDFLGFDLKALCLEGSLSELSRTVNAQPAILTVSVIAYRYYMSQIGAAPKFVAGHSLGEYSALVASGALSFRDGLKIVRQRGVFMEEAASADLGKMIAVKETTKEWIEQVCQNLHSEAAPVVVGCYNTPSQFVISAHRQAVPRLVDLLDRYRMSYTLLNVSGPFHSPLMQGAADKLETVLNDYSFQDLKCPVISNVTAKAYPSKGNIADGLLLQMVSPVRWEQTIQYLIRHKAHTLIEIGPRSVLSKMAKEINATLEAYALDQENLEIMKTRFSTAFHKRAFINQCLSIAISTRNRNHNDQQYETGVLAPVRKLKRLLAEHENGNVEPAPQQLREAAEWVELILLSKGVPEEERNSAIRELTAGLEDERISLA